MTDANPSPSSRHMNFLRITRDYELGIAKSHFPSAKNGFTRPKVLEIGAGTGQQAKLLSQLGYDVIAIDTDGSRYRKSREYEISEYDGENIPADDDSFDAVFTSNVMEHVIHIDKVLEETYRILKSGGIGIHIIPSPACRLWSIPSHYLWLMQRIARRAFPFGGRQEGESTLPRTPASAGEWLGTFFPLRHGERGNTLTEAFYLSRKFWSKKFISKGFFIEKIVPNEIFYTMSCSLGERVGVEARRRFSRVLGSSCWIYVVRK